MEPRSDSDWPFGNGHRPSRNGHQPTSAPTILIVEADAALRTFLADNLTADGYELLVAADGADGLRLLERGAHLAVVGLALPDGSGLQLVDRVRASDGLTSRVDPNTPLILLSARAGELDRLRGFEHGIDDFVAKPVSYPELRARIAALLRRSRPRPQLGRVRVGELEIDPVSRDVHVAGRLIPLAQKEFALLHALAGEPTRVFTKEELLKEVWGFRSPGATRTVDAHACRLRHKLAINGQRFIINVWGVGYRLVESPVAR